MTVALPVTPQSNADCLVGVDRTAINLLVTISPEVASTITGTAVGAVRPTTKPCRPSPDDGATVAAGSTLGAGAVSFGVVSAGAEVSGCAEGLAMSRAASVSLPREVRFSALLA